jgi:hypothetical protein
MNTWYMAPDLFRLLPSGQSTVTAEEAAMLAVVFAEDGELPARPAGTSTWKGARFGMGLMRLWQGLKPL